MAQYHVGVTQEQRTHLSFVSSAALENNAPLKSVDTDASKAYGKREQSDLAEIVSQLSSAKLMRLEGVPITSKDPASDLRSFCRGP